MSIKIALCLNIPPGRVNGILWYTKFDGKWKQSFIIKFLKKEIPKNYTFMIRKDWNFFDKILQAASYSTATDTDTATD